MTTVGSGQAWTAQQGAYRAAVQRRVLTVLTAGQVLGGIGVGLGVAAGTLVARELSGSEVVGAATMPPVGLNVRSLSVINDRSTASCQALSGSNRHRLDHSRHQETVRFKLSVLSGTKRGGLCERW